MNNAIGAVVGPLASEKNKSMSMKWSMEKERLMNE
jgi:hypothetical protein